MKFVSRSSPRPLCCGMQCTLSSRHWLRFTHTRFWTFALHFSVHGGSPRSSMFNLMFSCSSCFKEMRSSRSSRHVSLRRASREYKYPRYVCCDEQCPFLLDTTKVMYWNKRILVLSIFSGCSSAWRHCAARGNSTRDSKVGCIAPHGTPVGRAPSWRARFLRVYRPCG